MYAKRPWFGATGVLPAALISAAACGSAPATPGAQKACHLVLPQSCPTPAPSYAADVAPILTERCVSCHGPGAAQSGIDVSNYAAVYANREPVLAQIYNCSMPLAGAPSLSDAQAATLLGWLVCSAPYN